MNQNEITDTSDYYYQPIQNCRERIYIGSIGYNDKQERIASVVRKKIHIYFNLYSSDDSIVYKDIKQICIDLLEHVVLDKNLIINKKIIVVNNDIRRWKSIGNKSAFINKMNQWVGYNNFIKSEHYENVVNAIKKYYLLKNKYPDSHYDMNFLVDTVDTEGRFDLINDSCYEITFKDFNDFVHHLESMNIHQKWIGENKQQQENKLLYIPRLINQINKVEIKE